MELKLFDLKSVLIGPKGLLPFSTSNFKLSPFFCSYKGNFSHVAGCASTSQGAVSLVGEEKYGVETYSYRYDGSSTNLSSSILFRENRVLDAFDDEYGGIVVNPDKLPFDTNVFASILQSSLSVWRTEEGFQYHHAERGYTYWIPNEPCMLPANASHQVGVG